MSDRFTIEPSVDEGYHLLLEDGVVIARSKSRKQMTRVHMALVIVEGDEVNAVAIRATERCDKWMDKFLEMKSRADRLAAALRECCNLASGAIEVNHLVSHAWYVEHDIRVGRIDRLRAIADGSASGGEGEREPLTDNTGCDV